jgi:iduronate 2-sulfatase
MGLSMVTPQYHYVEWRNWDHLTGVVGELAAIELYDQQADPDENKNIAKLDENAKLVQRLSQELRRGWRSAGPPR